MKWLESLRRKRWLRLTLLAVLCPVVVYLCAVTERKYYLSSLLMVFLTLGLFFLSFERRNPQTRELVLLAVVCALAVAARIVVPFASFKPTVAVIMLAGIAFGAESGFLCGAMTALVSNFFFSQGPWTPWQMLAYGAGGLLAGLLAKAGILKRRITRPRDLVVLTVFGFVCIILVVGPILDTSTVMIVNMNPTGTSAGIIYLTGLVSANLQHGAAVALTLALFGKPFLGMLQRIQVKYGLLQDSAT